jgi:hypothetical protein
MERQQPNHRKRKLRTLRANPIARKSDLKIAAILQKPRSLWPKQFSDAFDILHSEHGLPELKAITLTRKCAEAAIKCVRAHNYPMIAATRRELQITLRKCCAASANGLAFVPSRIRQKLDHDISGLLKGRSVDLEVIEDILRRLSRAIAKVPAAKRSETLRQAIVRRQFKDFQSLHPAVLENCYDALDSFVGQARPGAIFRAKDVLMVLANAIGHDKLSKIHLRPYNNERRLISVITPLCRAAGLGTQRTTNTLNPERRTKFLRFANLVYAGALELMGERSDGSGLPYRQTNEKPQAPQAETESNSKKNSNVNTLPGCDLNLITSDHLRK